MSYSFSILTVHAHSDNSVYKEKYSVFWNGLALLLYWPLGDLKK